MAFTALSFLSLLLFISTVGSAFKICAFNIKSFGEAKAANPAVMHILIKILSRCDISLIQEVRDAKQEAVATLLKELNRFDHSHSYACVESQRLGKSSYKEQYVFIYRGDIVKVTDWYQYEDNKDKDPDAFCRDPFIVRVQSPLTVIQDFVLVSQHTCPKDAVREIDRLYKVFLEVKYRWRTENIMFLGDLNAACSYVSAEDWKKIQLRKNPSFHWLIGDGEDTTVSEKTHCAYDRIVVHGDKLLDAVVPGSAKTFNFKKKFRLSEEEALEVSDHYPVEVDLKLIPRTHHHEL
ncbi:deoxyribonuclease gamma-like [Latimeria chalumnae]|uniref:deoxyribonuclease gamma-like n=1 Tax=Latimeria chalumnae TaxID=7897 RepID=UPI0003C18A16|nr:PREDICTED: deoxyribonuclease gamma-like [Latimeria chalumnae]|eukprot:XP_006002582.1 PREDICTED: deoxyribonuclease gamma-like [Latimeria chalumnae]